MVNRRRELIEQLAESLDRPIRVVESIYREEWDTLAQRASIPDYLPIFAARRTRERIRNGRR